MDSDQPHRLEWDMPKERSAEVDERLAAAGLQFGSIHVHSMERPTELGYWQE